MSPAYAGLTHGRIPEPPLKYDITEKKKENNMGRLTGISFAGVDEKTDISKLQRLQAMDPRVEFGILLFENWEEKGNRYHNPGKLERFRGRGLNLCAHLCGSIACAAKRNDWEPAMEFTDLSLFTRVQLNLANSPP